MIKTKTKLITLYDPQRPLQLERGGVLSRVQVAYETYGTLNPAGDNAILVCHALTGDAHVAGYGIVDEQLRRWIPLYAAKREDQAGWWDGLIGPGKTIDSDRYFVVCSNVLGSCYGTTGPASVNEETGQIWGTDFPEITVRDMVRVQKALLESIGVSFLRTVIGGSLGGMQVLEWALIYPEMVGSLIPVATAARHSNWAVGFSHLMRQAIRNDPQWQQGRYRSQPERGLSLARQIGMISYRTDIDFRDKFKPGENGENGGFEVERYLNYQGRKLVERFDANTLLTLTEVMDRHDVGRDRGGVAAALSAIDMPALCLGIDSDILYPASEQRAIARAIPGARYHEITSRHGHDAFLIEFEQMKPLIASFLKNTGRGKKEKTAATGNDPQKY